MTFKELQNKSLKDLKKMDKEKREELFGLRLKQKTSQLEKTHQLKEIRHDIARIQMRLGQLVKEQPKAAK